MFTRFCMLQKLRALLNPSSLHDVLKPLAKLFDTAFNSDIRGSRLEDALPFDAYLQAEDEEVDWTQGKLDSLDPKTSAKLRPWIGSDARLERRVMDKDTVRRLDLRFSTEEYALGDSQVVYKTTEELCGWSAGSISRIFCVRWTTPDDKTMARTFAVIHRFQSLSRLDAQLDPYRRFGFAGGRLFYSYKDPDALVIPLRLITAHFARSEISVPGITSKTVHVLPQNRVR
ncbi:hypothetical protein K435DRAFT_686655 [Dendrothele bispora CBS 962.96]|uniref:Uncharacterized protein n=1 Tax=Dendrothele bispora (strain CBS 962.96) TaxID=1314807 RepID=A0A4S8L857_DENBC|nr:hypothetical protein K435DRAFT_686655 [Dendrothele bispora CBS 962.96]